MARARNVVYQGRVVASMASTAFRALLQRVDLLPRRGGTLTLPGAEIVARVSPRPRTLMRDYLRHVGGDPRSYEGSVPPHFFPQWTFPVVAMTLRGLPFPLLEIVNGGCRLEMNGPLPAGEPLDVRARLESVEDDGHRAVLRQRVVTGPVSSPDSLIADVFAVVPSVPSGKRNGSRGTNGAARPRKEPPRVPTRARELAYWSLGADAGLTFAMLTGDFNPVHWSRRYARALGWGGTILHGFATMARAIEGLNRSLFAGAADRMRVVDVRFTRPLCLPARVGLYLDDATFFVGPAPGGPAHLVGTFVPSGAAARIAPEPVSRVTKPGATVRQINETRP